MSSKEKIKLTFLRRFDDLLSSIVFLKEFLRFNGCFWLFTNIEKTSGAIFWCRFPVLLLHIIVLYLMVYQWIKFRCHIFFSSQNIKQNWLSSFYLDS